MFGLILNWGKKQNIIEEKKKGSTPLNASHNYFSCIEIVKKEWIINSDLESCQGQNFHYWSVEMLVFTVHAVSQEEGEFILYFYATMVFDFDQKS